MKAARTIIELLEADETEAAQRKLDKMWAWVLAGGIPDVTTARR